MKTQKTVLEGTWNVYSDQYKQTKKFQGLEVTEQQQQQQQQLNGSSLTERRQLDHRLKFRSRLTLVSHKN